MSARRSGSSLVLSLVVFFVLPAFERGAQAGEVAAEGERRATVRVPAGSALREVASPVAGVLAVLEEAAELPVLDRSGDWVRVALGERTGWVDLAAAAPDADGPPEPDGLLQPAGAETAVALLAAARDVFGAAGTELDWGRFAVVTDRPDHPLLPLGARIAAELPALHARRYGLPEEPAASPGEAALLPPRRGTIVLFGRDADYLEVLAGVAVEAAAQALAGYAEGGVAVLPLGDRTARQAAGTLVHEIAHLLNQHAFGPGLPPWLDEGLAGDLELVEIGAGGELIEARWAEGPLGYRGRRTRTGPLIALDRLLTDAARGRLETLPELLALDRRSLVSSPRRPELYALTALWVRYLLDDPDRAAAFRRVLAALAAPASTPTDGGAALLAEALATDLATLERPFRRWLQDLARRH